MDLAIEEETRPAQPTSIGVLSLYVVAGAFIVISILFIIVFTFYKTEKSKNHK